ncbi:efflux RND transporter periplasmic adaptor subunit [Candidatus Sumerlaeota bacterium]|nr:efflux RND transporter periplasmic adaptor subunit [Candidatus Sumerlaeota bacterium]
MALRGKKAACLVTRDGCGRALALLGLAFALGCRPSSTPEDESGPRSAVIEGGLFQVTVSATGRVEPAKEVDVSSKASGEIIELPFDEGDVIKKGALLARLDPDDERRNVTKKQSELKAAQARLAKARSELELVKSSNEKAVTDAQAQAELAAIKLVEAESKHKRQDELFRRELVSEDSLETALTAFQQARSENTQAQAKLRDTENLYYQVATREQDVKLAEVEVANAKIGLEEVEERLADTEIIAPMDGVLTVRYVEPGMVISSAISNVGGGTLLMVVADLSTLFVVASVDEADIGGIELGQKAMLKTDAFPDAAFEGRVAHIAPVGIETSSVVTFDVEIEVVGEGLSRLRPGMTADVTIVLAESKETMWVLTEAIKEGPKGYYVEVVEDDEPVGDVPVKLGITDGVSTELMGAVEPGQRVSLRPWEELTPWERGENTKRPGQTMEMRPGRR